LFTKLSAWSFNLSSRGEARVYQPSRDTFKRRSHFPAPHEMKIARSSSKFTTTNDTTTNRPTPTDRFTSKMSATLEATRPAGQKKTFGKSTREVPHHSQKAKKWYPAEDEAAPKKVCYFYFLRLCDWHIAVAGCILVQSSSGMCEPDCLQHWSDGCTSFQYTPRAATNGATRSEKPFVPLLPDQLSLPVLSSSSSLVASVASASSS